MRITAKGQIQTFDLPRKVEHQYSSSVGNIAVGPDGNLWFPLAYTNGGDVGYGAIDRRAIGRIDTFPSAAAMSLVYYLITLTVCWVFYTIMTQIERRRDA